MKELFTSLYNLNEDYHNKKEQMLWLAATVYLGFSVTIIGWLTANKAVWQCYKLLFSTFIVLLFLVSAIFMAMQNWYKCRSVLVTGRLLDILERLDASNKPKYKDFRDAMAFPKRTNFIRRVSLSFKIGGSGVLILAAATMFCIVQVVLIYSVL